MRLGIVVYKYDNCDDVIIKHDFRPNGEQYSNASALRTTRHHFREFIEDVKNGVYDADTLEP